MNMNWLIAITASCVIFPSEFTNAFMHSKTMKTAGTFICPPKSRDCVSLSGSNDSNTMKKNLREENWENEKLFQTTKSGLKTYDIVVGEGDSPASGDLLSVHYVGWYDHFEEEKVGDVDEDNLEDNKSVPACPQSGVQFDNSRDRGPEPLQLIYDQSPIIEGWQEGLKTMKAGGKREFIIPPELGYGDKEVKAPGQPAIPANSYLRFVIELVEVDNSLMTKFRIAIPKPSALFDKSFF